MFGKTPVFGVDIGQHSIKIAQVKQTGNGFSVKKLAHVIIPEELRKIGDKQALRKLITDLIEPHKLQGHAPVICISAGDAIVKELAFSGKPKDHEVEGLVEAEMGDFLPYPVNQVYLDFVKVSKDDKYLAAASRRELVDNKTYLLSGLGKKFKDVQVDIDCFAFGRLLDSVVSKDELEEDQAIMLIDVGYSRSRFYAFHKNDMIFNREISIGGSQVTDMIHEVYDVPKKEAEERKLNNSDLSNYKEHILQPYLEIFVEQSNIVFDFFQSSKKDINLKSVYLTGGGSALFGLIDGLRGRIDYPVEQLSLRDYISVDNDDDGKFGDFGYSLAIALALEGKK